MDNVCTSLEDFDAFSDQNQGVSFHRDTTSERAKLFETDKKLEKNLVDQPLDTVLTKREKEVLSFILAGKTNKEIAHELYRTERTVEYHRNRMMRKLGTHTTVELFKRAIAMGIA